MANNKNNYQNFISFKRNKKVTCFPLNVKKCCTKSWLAVSSSSNVINPNPIILKICKIKIKKAM